MSLVAVLDPPMPSCAVCELPSMLRCAYCNSGPAYCSSSHFREHWVTHAVVCDGSAIHPDSLAAVARATDAPTPGATTPVVADTVSSGVTDAESYEVMDTATHRSTNTTLREVADPPQYQVTDPAQHQFAYAAHGQYTDSAPYTLSVSMGQVVGCYLGAYATVPTFVYVRCCNAAFDGVTPRTYPDLSAYFQYGYGSLVMHFDAQQAPLPQPLHFIYCARSYVERRFLNQSVRMLVSSRGHDAPRSWKNWPGSLIVFKYKDDSCTVYEDLTQMDLVYVRSFFEMFGSVP
ncbi:uncharacterized protein TRAVEDRAFT_25089 [Trametes versicolor FP-101664 SS1]|uniref:Uncharacterized protein n=1 Tax=Trametes versicolor (strain FP-101664) TaxID=717944 RepID=R7S6D4_TRAVS|nr:uncharacterized protein TRAVEDRAFT_25089 [Trametes versicolor FP-101664 SS1]EIW51426.1 hypothetical protein TRAVEDRAFT_25089 [Trametes versicolor FP-101664 SS1]